MTDPLRTILRSSIFGQFMQQLLNVASSMALGTWALPDEGSGATLLTLTPL